MKIRQRAKDYLKLLVIVIFSVFLSCKVTIVQADPVGDFLEAIQNALTIILNILTGAEEAEDVALDVEGGTEIGDLAAISLTLGDISANTTDIAAAVDAADGWSISTVVALAAGTVAFVGAVWEMGQLGEWGAGQTDVTANAIHTLNTDSNNPLTNQLANYQMTLNGPVSTENDKNQELNKNKATGDTVKAYSNTSAATLVGGHYQYSESHSKAAHNFVINSSGAGVGMAKADCGTHPTRECIAYSANFNHVASNQSHTTMALSAIQAGGVSQVTKDKKGNQNTSESTMSKAMDTLTFQACFPANPSVIQTNAIYQIGCLVFNAGASVPAGLYVFAKLQPLFAGLFSGMGSMITAAYQKGFLDPSKSQTDISQIGADTNSSKK